MMLNESLFRKQVNDWIAQYAREHPEDDVDALRDRLADASLTDFDTPTDFMEGTAQDQAPTFYHWWAQRMAMRGESEATRMQEAYEQEYEVHKARGICRLSEAGAGIEGTPTDRLVDLVQRDADLRPLLRRIVTHESRSSDGSVDAGGLSQTTVGWHLEDVAGLTSTHVEPLLDAGVLRRVDGCGVSGRYVADVEAIEEALRLQDDYDAEARAAGHVESAAEDREWRKLWHTPCPVCGPHTLLDHATQKDADLLREALAQVARGQEPDLSDCRMNCLKCACYVSRTAAFVRILEAARKARSPAVYSHRTATPCGFLEGVELSAQAIEGFERVLGEQNGLEYASAALAPKVVGLEPVKRALVVALASLPDLAGDRNRVHVLLWGEPGTAKTELAREVHRLGGGWADHGTSDVGLTADASGGELSPGLLPTNHGGVVGIDELDKFDLRDQNGVLEAMETGELSVNRGAFVNVRLPAAPAIIATANRIDKLRPELVSRFDFVIHVDLPTVQEAQAILDDRITWWNRPKGLDAARLAHYLTWARSFTPRLPESVRTQARAFMGDYIVLSGETRVRRLERVIRIAMALARLSHRDAILEDFKRAVGMLHQAPSDSDGA